MNNFLLPLGIILIVVFTGGVLQHVFNYNAHGSILVSSMHISSPTFKDHEYMPSTYSCDGAGLNPPLTFTDVPKEAKSLVLIVDDPDAPMGTFVHWVVYNIPSTTVHIEEGKEIPGSLSGKNNAGSTPFFAACPPSGTHRYFFKLYALRSELNLHSGATKAEVEKAMEAHILAQAELVGLYKRK